MRKVNVFALLALALLRIAIVTAADISVCRERVDSALMERYPGWQLSGSEFVFTFSGINWNAETAGYTGQAMTGLEGDSVTVLADGNTALWAYYDADGVYVEIVGDATAVWCGEEWQPGAPSVPLIMTSDCAYVEIVDPHGNWHLVTSDGAPVLLHYGEALIGGRNQSVDSADYRVIATPCF